MKVYKDNKFDPKETAKLRVREISEKLLDKSIELGLKSVKKIDYYIVNH